MILGSGGIGIMLESEEGACRRFQAQVQRALHADNLTPNNNNSLPLRKKPFCCRLLATLISNSAYHGASMDKDHIASEMERFVSSIEKENFIPRKELALHGVYFSHETSTHASATSSCAYNEVFLYLYILLYLCVRLFYLFNCIYILYVCFIMFICIFI